MQIFISDTLSRNNRVVITSDAITIMDVDVLMYLILASSQIWEGFYRESTMSTLLLFILLVVLMFTFS